MSVTVQVVHPDGAVVVEHLAPGFICRVAIGSARKSTGDVDVQVTMEVVGAPPYSVSREGRQVLPRPRRSRKRRRPRVLNRADTPATAGVQAAVTDPSSPKNVARVLGPRGASADVTIVRREGSTAKELDIELLEYMAVAPRGDAQFEELKALAESDPRAQSALDRVMVTLQSRPCGS